MNVLLGCRDVFAEVGGGQRFYSNLILNNPAIQFYFFQTAGRPETGLPRNAHPIATGSHYRQHSADFGLDRLPRDNPAAPLAEHAYELALLMDMATAIPAVAFDLVDLPDFLPFGVYVPEFLKYFSVKFDKVVLSMHGTISMALLDNWDEELNDLSSLVEHEDLFYRYCDLRYGIGRQYVQSWASATKLPGELLDISTVYPARAQKMRAAQRSDNETAIPDLCFVGRQEKWKGPDLFLELCSNLPRDAFGEVRMFGPSVNIHGNDSAEALARLAQHRSLDLQIELVPPDQVIERLRQERLVVVLPSRRDTFNLVALEALLNGCPAVVSVQCGACDFLDAAYPGIPYVKLDPDDLLGSYDEIVSLLANYDERRRLLRDYLVTAKPKPYGLPLPQVYAGDAHPDGAARRLVGQRFHAFAAWLERGFLRRSVDAFAARAGERCGEVQAAYNCPGLSQQTAEQEFRHAADIVQIWQEVHADSGEPANWGIVDRAQRRLGGYVFGGSRSNLYRLMAERERARGNDLLWATYWLRIMRLAGAISEAVVHDVQLVLTTHGFDEEANVVGLLYRDDENEIFRYLARRRERLHAPPEGGLAETVEINRPAGPRVSVIVSAYNAAGKVDTFVTGLERFTTESKAISEIVFVDSASTDDTRQALLDRLQIAAERGIGALYLRSQQRETIQKAWNRGIAEARGDYLAFLGVDEMDRPDGIAKMAAFLDRRPDIDWVQGRAVITEVNPSGSYVRDVMAYDRSFDSQHIHYLECCYISYVGALYRKTMHDRVGFYDDRFRAAGDTEFKNRALPSIQVETLPETLGTFLNYPEARTTQSPTAELEDLRAWYLHRTVGGIRYALEDATPDECIQQFRRALHYKKSYMEQVCTDVDYAANLAEYMRRHRPQAFAEIEHFVPNLEGLRLAYQRLDRPAVFDAAAGLKGAVAISSGLEHSWFAIAQAYSVHKLLGLPAEYRATNDNRWHQHHVLWSSEATTTGQAAAALAAAGQATARPWGDTEPLEALFDDGPFIVDLSASIPGSGWYEPEYYNQTWYRWTGPRPEFGWFIRLPADRALRCTMRLGPVRAEAFDGFSVTVNGTEAPYEHVFLEDAVQVSFAIPQAAIHRDEPSHFLFRHDAVYRPESGDQRRLGFAVRSIVFAIDAAAAKHLRAAAPVVEEAAAGDAEAAVLQVLAGDSQSPVDDRRAKARRSGRKRAAL